MNSENDYQEKKIELIKTIKDLDLEGDHDFLIFNYYGKKEEIKTER